MTSRVGIPGISSVDVATQIAVAAASALSIADVAATVTADGALVVGRHNPVDATSGNRAMTLANATAAGQMIAVEKTDSTANTVVVTLNLRGTAGGTLTLVWQNEALLLKSKADGSWWPVAGHKTKASLDTAYGSAAAAAAAPVQSVATRTGAVVLTSSDVGLGNVNNTADSAKPVSTAQASADTAVQSAAIADAATKYLTVAAFKLGQRRNLPHPSLVDAVMASPPTVGALSTTSGITSGVLWPSVTVSGTTIAVPTGFFAYLGGGGATAAGTSFPNSNFVKFTSLTTTNATTAPYRVDFVHDGTQLELYAKGNGAKIRIRVDGQLVSATATTMTNDGNLYYLPLTFGSRATRHIAVEGDVSYLFGGVQAGPNDSIWKPGTRGPRAIVVGDSFTEGVGATTNCQWYGRKMAEMLGWPEMWQSGVGGTGYLNPGTTPRVKFHDRLTNDVTQWTPDVVIWAGGINDQGAYTAAAIQAEALACYQAVQAAVPAVIQIVLSPFWRGGVETYTAALLDTRDAIKAAAAAATTASQPVYFVDVLEFPLESTAATSTLAAGASANATTISSNALFPKRSVIEIDTGSTRERRVVTNVSGAGPYTLTVAALTNTHSSGASVTQVGQGFWTGTGKVGSTTGSGNADLLVSSDGTHPTQAGHDELGALVARCIARSVLAA